MMISLSKQEDPSTIESSAPTSSTVSIISSSNESNPLTNETSSSSTGSAIFFSFTSDLSTLAPPPSTAEITWQSRFLQFEPSQPRNGVIQALAQVYESLRECLPSETDHVAPLYLPDPEAVESSPKGTRGIRKTMRAMESPKVSRLSKLLQRLGFPRSPNPYNVFLKNTNLDFNLPNLCSTNRLPKVDSFHFWNCTFNTSDPFLLALYASTLLIKSKHGGEWVHGVQFAFGAKGRTIKVVISYGSSRLMPDSSNMAYGLILYLGQDLPYDLLLSDVSFLVFLPSKTNIPPQQLYVQFKRSLDSIIGHPWPKLKHLFLKGVSIDDFEDMSNFIQSFGLEVDDLQNLICLEPMIAFEWPRIGS
jgi:hypothetical protein